MRIALRWLMIVCIALVLAACEPAAEVPPTPTETPIPAETATPEPTATRQPQIEATAFFGRDIQSGLSSATIRIIHAAPDIPALDVRLQETSLVGSLGYGLASGLTTVIPGDYTLSVRQRGQDTALAETSVRLTAGQVTDVVIAPAPDGNIQIVIANGPAQAVDGGTGIVRAINAVSDADALTVRLNDVTTESALAVGGMTDLQSFPQGDLETVFSAGANQIFTNTLRLRELTSLTLVLTGTTARPQLLVFEAPVFGRYSLRVVNMSAAAREVDVYFDESLVASNLGYQAATERTVYSNAAATLSVHAANADLTVSTPLLSGQRLAPRAGTTVTLAIYGPVENLRAMWIEEDLSPVPAGYSRLVFAHILPDVQTLRVGVNSNDREDIPPIRYGDVSAPVLFGEGDLRLFLRDGSRDGVIVELYEAVSIPAGQSIIYFASGAEFESPIMLGDTVDVDETLVVNPIATPAGVFNFRYVNAIASQPIIDIVQEGVPMVTALPFGAVSAPNMITSNDFQLDVTMSGSGGATLVDVRIGVADPGNYTVYIYGSADNGFEAVILPDAVIKANDSIGTVRLVNLTTNQFSHYSVAVVASPVMPPNFTPTPTIAPTATATGASPSDSGRARLPGGINAVIRQIGARQASNASGVIANGLVYIVNEAQEIVVTLQDVPFAAGTHTDIVFYEYPTAESRQTVVFTVVYPAE